MTKQLLYYEKIVPVSTERHSGWSVQQGGDYSFSAEANAAPLICPEFAAAAVDLPIVFGKTASGFSPMVVLGIEENRSILVDSKGNWQGNYIPAFVRRYPFVFATDAEQSKFTLCLDEAFKGCDEKGKKGERLYTDDGEPGEILNKALEFGKSYEIEARRTNEFCKLLEEADLLDPMQVGMTTPDGERRAVTGFHAVSREKLKALEGEQLADFFRRDALELIYYHLASLRNMEKLRKLME